jgi:hypothetical protein
MKTEKNKNIIVCLLGFDPKLFGELITRLNRKFKTANAKYHFIGRPCTHLKDAPRSHIQGDFELKIQEINQEGKDINLLAIIAKKQGWEGAVEYFDYCAGISLISCGTPHYPKKITDIEENIVLSIEKYRKTISMIENQVRVEHSSIPFIPRRNFSSNRAHSLLRKIGMICLKSNINIPDEIKIFASAHRISSKESMKDSEDKIFNLKLCNYNKANEYCYNSMKLFRFGMTHSEILFCVSKNGMEFILKDDTDRVTSVYSAIIRPSDQVIQNTG